MRRLLVAVAILFAGCTGPLADGGTPDQSSVTAAPVPEASGDVVLPQTVDGTPAVGRIIAAHRTALSTRSFHLQIVRDGGRSSTDVWVDREADIVRVRRVWNGSTDDAVVADGTRYDLRANGTVATSPADGTPFLASESGFFLLQQRVAGLVYNRTGTTTRNGTTLAVLRATTSDSSISRSGFRTVIAANSTLSVAQSGIIREVTHEERYADDAVRTLNMTLTPGASVSLPAWYRNTTA
jgi:hypothetical protein